MPSLAKLSTSWLTVNPGVEGGGGGDGADGGEGIFDLIAVPI